MPVGNQDDVALAELDLARVWHPFQQATTYQDRQLIVTKAEGARIWGADGKSYLDAISGLWNVNLGYSERRVVDAVAGQLGKMPFTSLIVFSHEPSIRLADGLVRRAPDGLEAVHFTSGGSEAVDTAIKLVRHANVIQGRPLRQKILSLHGAYHGMSYGALSVTGFATDKAPFVIETPGSQQVPSAYSSVIRRREVHAAELIDHIRYSLDILDPSTVGAIIVEPVMGVAGMIPQPQEYLAALRAICDDHDIYLILDEVACGIGRTGSFFAADYCGVRPDMIILAKGLTGGYAPLGAVLVSGDLFALCQSGPESSGFMHGYTYGGHPASCAAALAVLEVIDEDQLLEKVEKDGQYLRDGLTDVLAGTQTTPVRGAGLLIGFDVHSDGEEFVPQAAAPVVRAARDRGVIIRATYGGFTINVAPPYVCTRDELDRLIEVVGQSVRGVR